MAPTLLGRCMSLLTSTIGLFLINLAYLLLGAWLFLAIEAPREESLQNNLEEERDTLIDQIIILGLGPQEYYLGNASDRLASYELSLANFYRKRATFKLASGNESLADLKLWTPYGAIIYCYSVITTIGWGNIVPATVNGRLGTVIYGLNGMPLLFTLSSDVGNMCSQLLIYTWTKVRTKLIKKKSKESRKRSRHESEADESTNNRKRCSTTTSCWTSSTMSHADFAPTDKVFQSRDCSQDSCNSSYLRTVRSALDFLLYASNEESCGRVAEEWPRYRIRSLSDAMQVCELLSRLPVQDMIKCMEYAGVDYSEDLCMAGMLHETDSYLDQTVVENDMVNKTRSQLQPEKLVTQHSQSSGTICLLKEKPPDADMFAESCNVRVKGQAQKKLEYWRTHTMKKHVLLKPFKTSHLQDGVTRLTAWTDDWSPGAAIDHFKSVSDGFAVRSSTGHFNMFATSETQAQLLGRAETQAQLLGRAETQTQLLGRAETQTQLLGRAETQAQLLGQAVTQAHLLGQAVTQAHLLGQAVTQVQLLDRENTSVTVNEINPYRKPIGSHYWNRHTGSSQWIKPMESSQWDRSMGSSQWIKPTGSRPRGTHERNMLRNVANVSCEVDSIQLMTAERRQKLGSAGQPHNCQSLQQLRQTETHKVRSMGRPHNCYSLQQLCWKPRSGADACSNDINKNNEDNEELCTIYSSGRGFDMDPEEFVSGPGFYHLSFPEGAAEEVEEEKVVIYQPIFQYKDLAAAVREKKAAPVLEKFHMPLFVMYAFVILYVFFGSLVFYIHEKNMGFWDALYFVYVMLSTTGFGDILPNPDMYAFIVVFALVGMALYNIMINATLELFLEVLDYLSSIGGGKNTREAQ